MAIRLLSSIFNTQLKVAIFATITFICILYVHKTKLQDKKADTLDKASRNAAHVYCNDSRPSAYHGQGFEDKGLYEKFFSQPRICNGSFLEIGALDGRTYSNTLMFERDLNWNGILIEASPGNFEKLKRNRPKSHLYHAAACNERLGHVDFVAKGGPAVQGIGNEMNDQHVKYFKLNTSATVKVQCKSLGTLIRKSGYKSLDFAVIDVEGAELMVLETHDWTIPVHVFVVEMNRQQEQIRALLSSHGYRKMEWDIRQYCKGDCPNNEAFVYIDW